MLTLLKEQRWCADVTPFYTYPEQAPDMDLVGWREWEEPLTADGWDQALGRAQQRAQMQGPS